MKKKIGLLVMLVLMMICAFALADVAINQTNFPDENFREVVKKFDTNMDGALSNNELKQVTFIRCSELGISDMKGIEHFTALTELYCDSNKLTSLDVSKNTALIWLYCYSNQLTSLDVSKNTVLIGLECSSNNLTSLDVSKNTGLSDLYCNNNRLSMLDVRKNTALQFLFCNNNRLTSLDVSENTALQQLWCDNNRLTSLDVSKNTALYNLGCSFNQLTTLDVSKNTKLEGLSCSSNQLKELDISKVPILDSLVKETEPGQRDGYQYWEKETGYGWVYQFLYVDPAVNVITSGVTRPKKIDIDKVKITAIRDQVYTGKAIKPAVTAKYEGQKLVKGTDYTIAYKNNKAIGKATVTITGKGNYTGTKTTTFKIIPAGVKISSLTAGTKQLTVKWEKGSNITGYQLEYSLKKDFSNSKKLTVSKAATTEKVIKNLTAKKTYYVRIRTYKTVNGVKYYSAWSAAKSRKTK